LKQAYSLIELLAVSFMFSVFLLTANAVGHRHGPLAGLAAGVLGLLVSWRLVVSFYRWSWRRDKRRLQDLQENHRAIYRVRALPTEPKSIVKPDAAEIKIGDYGWEARPVRKDGLIHLQGLTTGWKVVWHASFRPVQLEKAAEKAVSQYDYWAPDWAKPPPPRPCPFPVLERSTPTMGLPHHSGHYFINYPSQYHKSGAGAG
jgi:membrane protein implicated in regulation of membrane protease activity